jgi:hypothetical protein
VELGGAGGTPTVSTYLPAVRFNRYILAPAWLVLATCHLELTDSDRPQLELEAREAVLEECLRVAEAVGDPGSRALLSQLLGYTVLGPYRDGQRHPTTLRRALGLFWRGLGVPASSYELIPGGSTATRSRAHAWTRTRVGDHLDSMPVVQVQLEGAPGDQQALLMDIVMTLKGLEALDEALAIARQVLMPMRPMPSGRLRRVGRRAVCQQSPQSVMITVTPNESCLLKALQVRADSWLRMHATIARVVVRTGNVLFLTVASMQVQQCGHSIMNHDPVYLGVGSGPGLQPRVHRNPGAG